MGLQCGTEKKAEARETDGLGFGLEIGHELCGFEPVVRPLYTSFFICE